MRYFFGLALPVIIQCLIVLIIVQVNTGNGSFAGLGAFLIGMLVIPATAITNGLYIRTHRAHGFGHVMVRCYLFALIAPFLLIFTLFF